MGDLGDLGRGRGQLLLIFGKHVVVVLYLRVNNVSIHISIYISIIVVNPQGRRVIVADPLVISAIEILAHLLRHRLLVLESFLEVALIELDLVRRENVN